jgi:hypothetical protein
MTATERRYRRWKRSRRRTPAELMLERAVPRKQSWLKQLLVGPLDRVLAQRELEARAWLRAVERGDASAVPELVVDLDG